jgi:hypothetical protein
VNGLPSCTQYVARDLAECNAANGGNCMSHAQCDPTAKNALSCTGPGGGGYTPGSCGDGVLQPAGVDNTLGTPDDEECDVRNATWCDSSCKILTTTNPGANPIADMWMTVPTLSSARLGYSWLDVPGRIRFSENRMVLGVGTSAFTVADTVGFGIVTAPDDKGLTAPLIVNTDKKICLVSSGTSVTNSSVCTTFGSNATPAYTPFPSGGKTYIVLGKGYYQTPIAGTNPVRYDQKTANNPNDILLFDKGTSNVYSNIANTSNTSLSQAFRGANVGNDGKLALYHYTADGAGIDLVTLDIRVSGAMAGSTSSTLSRGIESYVKPTPAVEIFLSRFKSGFGTIGTTASTTTAVTSTTSTATSMTNLTSGSAVNLTVAGLAGLDPYKVNGNNNVYAVKGNVTLNCTSGITATELA